MVRKFDGGTPWDEKAGNRLFLRNSKFKFFYAHLLGFNVVRVDVVKKGQVIAYSGKTGKVTGPHLHFDVRDRKTNKSLEPAFVDGG